MLPRAKAKPRGRGSGARAKQRGRPYSISPASMQSCTQRSIAVCLERCVLSWDGPHAYEQEWLAARRAGRCSLRNTRDIASAECPRAHTRSSSLCFANLTRDNIMRTSCSIVRSKSAARSVNGSARRVCHNDMQRAACPPPRPLARQTKCPGPRQVHLEGDVLAEVVVVKHMLLEVQVLGLERGARQPCRHNYAHGHGRRMT